MGEEGGTGEKGRGLVGGGGGRWGDGGVMGNTS